MSALDLLDDSFPHGTKAGYDRGCRGSMCPAPLKCREVRARYMGDYAFRKALDGGMTVEAFLAAEVAAVAQEGAAAAQRVKAERAALLASKPTPQHARKPQERPARSSRPASKPVAPTWRHGTQAGYDAGCFTTACPSIPTCADVNLGAREREAPTPRTPRPVAEQASVGHGSLTMYLRGCRDESCPADPSCSAVAKEHYTTRNRSLNRSVQGHGTNASWARGCRCEDCHGAHVEYHRAYNANRRKKGISREQHGTAYGYQLGCNSREDCPADPTCSDVVLAQDVARRRARGVAEKTFVDAEPVREHVAQLRGAGLTLKAVIETAGVSKSVVKNLLYGRSPSQGSRTQAAILRENADAILAVRVSA